jgi:hypothetical protein
MSSTWVAEGARTAGRCPASAIAPALGGGPGGGGSLSSDGMSDPGRAVARVSAVSV